MIKNGRVSPVAALGREGLQAARRPDLVGAGRTAVAGGLCHPAARDHMNYPGGKGDPEMRL
jgi:hypothetical protein